MFFRRNKMNLEKICIGWVSEYYFRLPLQEALFVLDGEKISLLENFLPRVKEVHSQITGVRYATTFYKGFIEKKILPKIFKAEIRGDFTKKEVLPKLCFSSLMSNKDKIFIRQNALDNPKNWTADQPFQPFEFGEFTIEDMIMDDVIEDESFYQESNEEDEKYEEYETFVPDINSMEYLINKKTFYNECAKLNLALTHSNTFIYYGCDEEGKFFAQPRCHTSVLALRTSFCKNDVLADICNELYNEEILLNNPIINRYATLCLPF